MSGIADSIKKIVEIPHEMYAVMATASDIDEGKRTCTITPLNGQAPVFDVPLQGVAVAGSWVLIPKEGSKVLAVFTSNKSASLVSITEVDKALLYASSLEFGDSNGQPVVLGDDLNVKLSELISKVEDLTTKLSLFSVTQSAASVGVLSPLVVGFNQLGADVNVVKSGLEQVNQTLGDHLSSSVKTV